MRSAWMVDSHRVEGQRMFFVYRMLDAAKPDAPPNREYKGAATPDRSQAQAYAEVLNSLPEGRIT